MFNIDMYKLRNPMYVNLCNKYLSIENHRRDITNFNYIWFTCLTRIVKYM